MQKISISTDARPDSEQFDFWREECGEGMFGVTGERPRPGAFKGRADLTMTGSLLRFEFDVDNFVTTRRHQEIARLGWQDWIAVFHEKGEVTQHVHRGREIVTRTGDLIVADFTLPFSNTPRGTHCLNDIWFLPRTLIEPHLPAGNGPLSTHFTGQTGVGAIIQAYIGGLGATLESLNELEAAVVADNLGRLIAIGCGSLAAEQRGAVDAGQLAAIKQHIRRNLADPHLSPGSVAAAHLVSIRRVHLLFEPTGTSFSGYVTQLRLTACHAALLDPMNAQRSVMDVAFAWGFNSLSTFYRGFARQFGMSPRDMRRMS